MTIVDYDLMAIHNELVDIQHATNWEDVRSFNNFNLVLKQYKFGSRNTLVPKDPANNEKLQNSRGIVRNQKLLDPQSLDEFVSLVSNEVDKIEESDKVRIDELEAFLKLTNISSFCEIGFRIPKLLKYYKNLGFKNEKGYDISRLNVTVAKKLGYDCDVHDLNDMVTSFPQDAYDLLLCYHVLEHTHDPVKSFEKLANSLKSGGLIHIEIPIEPGLPRLRYGHLIAMESGDLENIVRLHNLTVLNVSTKTHSNGPVVERIVAQKK